MRYKNPKGGSAVAVIVTAIVVVAGGLTGGLALVGLNGIDCHINLFWGCGGGGGGGTSLTAAPTVTLTANGQSALTVNQGDTYTLAWNSANAASCTLSSVRTDGYPNSSDPVAPNTSSSGATGLLGSYTFSCTNSIGQSAAQTVTIAAAPTVTLTANGQSSLIYPGTTYTLAWNSANASSCTLSYTRTDGYPNGSNPVAPNTSSSGPSGVQGSYTLTCTNSAGQSASKTVTVSPPAPTVTLTANGQSSLIYPGTTYTLAWNSANASSCTLSYTRTDGYPNGSNPVAPNIYGSGPSGLIGSYTLTCTNSAGQSAAQTVTISASCPNGSGPTGSCTACNSGYTLSGGMCILVVDICTDIPGNQSSLPTGCQTPVPSPGRCIPSGYTYNGTQCVILTPTISTFSASPSRVRANTATAITFSYNVTNPPSSCTISGPSNFTTLQVSPQSATTGTQPATVTLSQPTLFTFTCGAVSTQITEGLIPAVQEI